MDPQTTDPVRREVLSNGLTLVFYDRSLRYFGDYHRVRIEVQCRLADSDADLPLHNLERMGVAGAAVGQVREELIGNFLQSARNYLEQPDFPARLLARAQAEGRRRPPLSPVRR